MSVTYNEENNLVKIQLSSVSNCVAKFYFQLAVLLTQTSLAASSLAEPHLLLSLPTVE